MNDSNKSLWKSGEEAPTGFYACTNCDSKNAETYYNDEDGKQLPKCSKCKRTVIWYKV